MGTSSFKDLLLSATPKLGVNSEKNHSTTDIECEDDLLKPTVIEYSAQKAFFWALGRQQADIDQKTMPIIDG